MILGSHNLFCEPSPLMEPLAARELANALWSLNGVTWNAGNPPAGVAVYLRLAVPGGTDVSGAAYINFGAGVPEAAATSPHLSQLVDTTGTVTLAAGGYVVTVLAADDATVLFLAGTLTFS